MLFDWFGWKLVKCVEKIVRLGEKSVLRIIVIDVILFFGIYCIWKVKSEFI